MQEQKHNVTVRSLIVGTFFTALFALVTVFFENRHNLNLTASQIPALPFVLLFVMVLMINPICRFLRIVKRFSKVEVMVIFVMGSVSAGISTFGLAAQLVPAVSSLFNRHWNNDQSAWNLYVQPFVNEAYFISEKGIQEHSIIYREAVYRQKELQAVYNQALKLETLERQHRRAIQVAEKSTGMAAVRARNNADRLGLQIETAQEEWEELKAEKTELGDVGEVVSTFPALIAEQEKAVETARQELGGLEDKVFARVDLIRRGLPENMRAFPGFLPLMDEDSGIYLARLRRLRNGMKAFRHLETAEQTLGELEDQQGQNSDSMNEAADRIRQAVESLKPLADKSELEAKRNDLESINAGLVSKLLETQKQLDAARTSRRAANMEDFSRLDREINAHSRKIKSLNKDIQKLSSRREVIVGQLQTAARISSIVEDLESLIVVLGASVSSMGVPEIRDAIGEAMLQFRGFDASWARFFLGDIPWRIWLKPLFLWFVIMGLTYIILMTFNVLIFRQWAYNERLIYPLAELPEVLAGSTAEDDAGTSMIPAVFRSGLFWVGVSIPVLFLGWNLIAHTGYIPGITAIDLRNMWRPYIENSPLQGLLPRARSEVFFTLIGLTFLIPANISFSLWFFHIVYFFQLLILVWTGHGVNAGSFPSFWWYTLNFRTAQGGGALMVFSSVVLFKCRKYLFCFFSPKSIAELEAPERTELRICSFLFITASTGLIMMLWLGMGANFFYTVFVYFVMMAITIGLVRAVAEGGVLGFQAWVSPFHFIRSLFGMDKAWTAPPLFAPLMVYYSIMFLDIKTFIAPAMANCIKIRDDLKMERLRFHIAITLAILLAVIASVTCHILLVYSKGGDSMNGWFYNGYPRGLFNQIASMNQVFPVDTTAGRTWLGVGALGMCALLYFRRVFFWMPHPIGLIMFVNPIMAAYWFSIFLGWFAKRMVTKYGNKDTYVHVRKFFIGLIVGELIIIILALIVTQWLQVKIPIDLNRN